VWNAGEHVSLIGATGRGKTTLGMSLMSFRRAAVVWSPKPTDPTVDRYITSGTRFRPARPTHERPFVLVDEWPPPPNHFKVVLRPTTSDLYMAKDERRRVFHDCADAIMSRKVGHWCVFADDTYYLADLLGNPIHDDLVEMWAMGRSHGVSLVAGIQRPAYVPLLAYQATHLFFWRENDERNLKRISDIGVEDSALVVRTVRRLDAAKRQVLYVNTFAGTLSIVQLKGMV